MPLSRGDANQHVLNAYGHLLKAHRLLADHECDDIAAQLFAALGAIEERFNLATADQIAREIGFGRRL